MQPNDILQRISAIHPIIRTEASRGPGHGAGRHVVLDGLARRQGQHVHLLLQTARVHIRVDLVSARDGDAGRGYLGVVLLKGRQQARRSTRLGRESCGACVRRLGQVRHESVGSISPQLVQVHREFAVREAFLRKMGTSGTNLLQNIFTE